MPNNNGKIYRTSSKGVSILADIQHVLNETTNDTGALCRSSKINKWSFFKPINTPLRKELTTRDFYANNDGFDIEVCHNGPACYDVATSDSGGWSYSPSSTFHRPLDFNGYDHHAEPWFSPEFNGPSVIEKGGQAVRVTFPGGPSIRNNENLIKWIVENFSLFGANAGVVRSRTLEFGFIIKVNAGVNGMFFYNKVADVIDVLDDPDKKMSLAIPEDATDISTPASALVIPVIKTWTSMEDGAVMQVSRTNTTQSWYPLPCAPYSVTIEESGSSDLGSISINRDGITFSHSISGSNVTISNLRIPFVNDSTNKDIAIQVKITTQARGEIVFYDSQFTVSRNSTYTLSVPNKTYEAALTASCVLNIHIALVDGLKDRDDTVTLWNDKE